MSFKGERLIFLYPRRESNPNLKFRKLIVEAKFQYITLIGIQ